MLNFPFPISTFPCTAVRKPLTSRFIFRQQRFNRLTDNTMAVTRLKRKEKRNRAKANNRVQAIKQLTQKPIIKNVDIEAIKQEFAAKSGQTEQQA